MNLAVEPVNFDVNYIMGLLCGSWRKLMGFHAGPELGDVAVRTYDVRTPDEGQKAGIYTPSASDCAEGVR